MTDQLKPKTGPKPITYIPPQFRTIAGSEFLTTRGQLVRLRDYIESPVTKRAPFLRLGASVPQYGPNNKRQPSATYVVTVSGEISIIKMECDPRRAHRWFCSNLRPWNLAREFSAEANT